MKNLLGLFFILLLCQANIVLGYSVRADCPQDLQVHQNTITATSCSYSSIYSGGGVSNSSASANLATGQLRSNSAAFGNNSGIGVGGYGAALLTDTITLTGPLSGDLPVSVSMVIDGSFSGQYTPSQSMLGMLTLSSGSPAQISTSRIDVVYSSDIPTVTTNFVTGSHTENIINSSATNFSAILSADLLVSSTDPTFSILAQLSTWSSPSGLDGWMVANFGNTANLSISLPDGLGYTSDSGVFLSVNPVPIPAAAWLFGSGLLGFIGVSRRNRNRT
ncbi:VPLPA-CTERM sorting domain-containing protein [Candidatus Thiodiazotropha endoloripes]|uniref:VPLPA-CTERM sorting domain-containing protein n=1 Tax=Candidatus Thiodiazotropha endoloripes TaxID=1818881 RepID=UPI000B20A9A8|nr:VPLPA-CTERM sorting domain-containing protein [Candidatus Thiodiazotropha endoloripes]